MTAPEGVALRRGTRWGPGITRLAKVHWQNWISLHFLNLLPLLFVRAKNPNAGGDILPLCLSSPHSRSLLDLPPVSVLVPYSLPTHPAASAHPVRGRFSLPRVQRQRTPCSQEGWGLLWRAGGRVVGKASPEEGWGWPGSSSATTEWRSSTKAPM
jgi:hypothetical protein